MWSSMLQNQRKLDQVIKRERLLAWVAMQSILEHEHSQFDRKFHYMEVVHDIRFMGSPFILCHPAGLRIGLISSKYWFSQKINSQNLCTEFTSSNNFINNVIGADNTVKFAVLSDNSWLWTSYQVKWINKVYIKFI